MRKQYQNKAVAVRNLDPKISYLKRFPNYIISIFNCIIAICRPVKMAITTLVRASKLIIPRAMADNSKYFSLFKGCLLGGLVGDCLGFPYENERSFTYSVKVINRDVQDVLSGDPERAGERQYTDDTSMTISVAKFLLESTRFDYRDLAKRFYMFYKQEPKERSYGSHVHTVFRKLAETKFLNAFKPASEQFSGTGSLGNGSGMRVAPIALYTVSDHTLHRMVNIAINVSRITHTHPQGVMGGIFQTLAVRHGLLAGASRLDGKVLSPLEILDTFEEDFNTIVCENDGVPSIIDGFQVYRLRIQSIRKFIQGGFKSWKIDDIKNELGVKVTAAESIPTSFFCFLASFENIPFLETENQFERAIKLAIALGGDTDTVAAMCGNICGAYVGADEINENFIKNCEDYQGITHLAEQMFQKLFFVENLDPLNTSGAEPERAENLKVENLKMEI